MNVHDLRPFDPTLARTLRYGCVRHMLVLLCNPMAHGNLVLGCLPRLLLYCAHRWLLAVPGAGRGLMGLTFDGVKEGGRDVPLTDSNKEEFVELLTQQVLIKSREAALAAVKTGFLSGVAELAPRAADILQTLSATDLMLLMHGGEAVSSELVRAHDIDDVEQCAT